MHRCRSEYSKGAPDMSQRGFRDFIRRFNLGELTYSCPQTGQIRTRNALFIQVLLHRFPLICRQISVNEIDPLVRPEMLFFFRCHPNLPFDQFLLHRVWSSAENCLEPCFFVNSVADVLSASPTRTKGAQKRG